MQKNVQDLMKKIGIKELFAVPHGKLQGSIVFATNGKGNLKRAKEKGYFIRCYYILTADSMINVWCVKVRVESGGHDVPEEKVIARYDKALALVKDVIKVCDICHIYDNSDSKPFRVYSMRQAIEEKFILDVLQNDKLLFDKKLKKMAQSSEPQIFIESIFPKAFGTAAQDGYIEAQESYQSLFEDTAKYNAIMSALAEVVYREMRKKGNRISEEQVTYIYDEPQNLSMVAETPASYGDRDIR